MTTRIVFLIPDLETVDDLFQLRALSGDLPKEQFDLHVLGFSSKQHSVQQEEPLAENWTTITRRSQTDLVAWWQFRKYLRHLEPHIVHLWQPLDFSWTTLLTDLFHHDSIAISLTDPSPRLIYHPDLAAQLICKRPYQFITTSTCLKDQLLRIGMPTNHCAVIPAAVPMCQPSAGDSKIISTLGLPPGSRLIGSLNRMQSWKQIQDLIWITAVLKVATDDVHLLMNGQGPHRQRLQRFAEQSQIQKHIHWIDPHQDVNQWLPEVDCYVETTRHLGHSRGILHGMSAGLPIAAFDCPGSRELVVSGEQGLFAPDGDCGSLARAVWKILGDPELASQLGKQGCERVEQRFTTARMVQSHQEVYQSIPIGSTRIRRSR